MASSLAPQDSYEFSQRSGSEFALRLIGHNAAGATTSTITLGGASLIGPAGGNLQEAPMLPLHHDPRLLASAVACALALAFTVAAAVLCIRRSKYYKNLYIKDY